MPFPGNLPSCLRAVCRPFVLTLCGCAVLGLVLGNVAANAVCFVGCTECECFRGAATGTHYKITDSESTVYKEMYWTNGDGTMTGEQLLIFKEWPSSVICYGGSTIEKLECGLEPDGENWGEGPGFSARGGTDCMPY